ncbi:MAG TPA: hypothetical protein VN915_12715 [Elusimicrobiota bacterium]|nr:hypothetical protein [Elusimicrobiota bacterium]
MRNRAAVLLLSLLALGRTAAAQVEVRPTAVIPSAPPAAALAAPISLNAVPTFAAPAAPAFAVPISAAALSPSPALAAVPAAGSAIAPAAAPSPALASPTLSQAFAAAAGPERPSAPSGAASAHAPTDAELAALFDAARPGSQAVATLSSQGSFGAAAGQIVHRYTFVGDHLLHGMRFSPGVMFSREGRQTYRAIEDLVSVADSRDAASRGFLEALGRRQAADFVRQEAQEGKFREFLSRNMGAAAPRRHMPRNDLGSGDYWDMAAGMNAGGFILRELEPGTRYSFFDFSPYVVSYLNAVAAHKGADAAAIEADILKLRRPERPLAVLRSKNAVAYVPGFEKKLSEMAGWVAPGGRLVLQNDPNPAQRGLIIEKHGPLARRLIEEGWDFQFEFASSRTAQHDLDTLIFTRPKTDGVHRSADETRELWGRYLAAVKYADAREGY